MSAPSFKPTYNPTTQPVSVPRRKIPIEIPSSTDKPNLNGQILSTEELVCNICGSQNGRSTLIFPNGKSNWRTLPHIFGHTSTNFGTADLNDFLASNICWPNLHCPFQIPSTNSRVEVTVSMVLGQFQIEPLMQHVINWSPKSSFLSTFGMFLGWNQTKPSPNTSGIERVFNPLNRSPSWIDLRSMNNSHTPWGLTHYLVLLTCCVMKQQHLHSLLKGDDHKLVS